MDIVEMRYFTCTYEEKRIVSAAERLFVSQQQISKVIKRIEEEFGAPLFVRTRNGLMPTKEGRAVYERFKRILGEFDALQAEMEERIAHHQGTLRVMMDVGIAQMLTQEPMLTFKRKYPEIELVMEEHREHNCKRLVGESEGDVGITICTRLDGNMRCVPICLLRAEVLVNERHRLADRSFITVEDLQQEKILFRENASYYTFFREYADVGSVPSVLVAITEARTAFSYLQNNSGVCPTVYTNKRKDPKYPPGVLAIPYQSKRQILLTGYTDKNRPSHPLGKLFLDHLIEYFR